MNLKVKKTVGNVKITIDLDDVYLHKQIIEELKNQGIFCRERTETIYCKDDNKILDIEEYFDIREVLNVLCRKGEIVLNYEEMNKHYKNKPVAYEIGGFKNEKG